MNKFRYINYARRTAALSVLEVGESVLLVPYVDGDFARESSSIKATGTRLKRKFALQSVLMVVEGETPERFLRITRLADMETEPEGVREPTQPMQMQEQEPDAQSAKKAKKKVS